MAKRERQPAPTDETTPSESVSRAEPASPLKRVSASAARKIESLVAHLKDSGTGESKLETIRGMIDTNPDVNLGEFVEALYLTDIAPGTIEKCRNYCIDIGLDDPKPKVLAVMQPAPMLPPEPLDQPGVKKNPFPGDAGVSKTAKKKSLDEMADALWSDYEGGESEMTVAEVAALKRIVDGKTSRALDRMLVINAYQRIFEGRGQ